MLNLKNTLDGYLKNVEVIGNTVQDTNNLANIRSVGDKVEGQELYKIDVVSCGKNLFDGRLVQGSLVDSSGILVNSLTGVSSMDFICVPSNNMSVSYTWKTTQPCLMKIYCYDIDYNYLGVLHDGYTSVVNGFGTISLLHGTHFIKFRLHSTTNMSVTYDIQVHIELGTQATSYEPYQEQKLEILSPVQLEKVGDVADRIICKDGVWGVDKKVNAEVKNNVLVNTRTKSEFISLPHDQQVKLRTFAGQTNIAFLTEIVGQIKAQVPKSLGATVNTHTEQIADLHNSLERVKKLEETTVSTIETERNFTTVDATSNGYFEDVKLEGKTLVNVLRLTGNWFEQETTLQTDSTTAVGLSQCTKTQDLSLLKSNTTYTVVPFIDYTAIKKGNLYLQLNTEINGIQNAVFRIDEAMFNKPTLITTKELTNKNSRSLFLGGANCEYKVKNVKILMLEGDHTNNPPSYFEGLTSVGQDVEEVNIESVNENLFDVNEFVKYCGGSVDNNVYCNTNAIADNIYPVFLPKGSTISWYTVESGTSSGATPFLGINKNGEAKVIMSIGNQGETKGLVLDEDFYGIQIKKWSEGYKLSNIQVRISKDTHNYIPHQSNKKPLLYYNPTTETWEKPVLRKWDTIEKHSDGKYYYHKRSREVVLNGSESWQTYYDTGVVSFMELQCFAKNNSYIYSDIFSTSDVDLYKKDIEGIFVNANGAIQLTILNSKLPTRNVQGFKQWLQTNNVTVVYQLAQEEVYECTNIDLMTYSGETNYIINSGAISPKSLLKVHNNISNVVKILQEKVSLLENTFIAGLKSVLSGDMYSLATLLYPEDFEQNDNIEQDIMVIPE